MEVINGTIVTGASDDLIEMEGELREEFDSFSCQNGVMAFSDGTLLRVKYDDDGIWRFKPLFKGSLFEKIKDGSVDEDTNDEVYFKTGLKWCAFSDAMQIEVNKYGYCYYAIESDNAIVFNLYVEPEYRRRGHAKKLIQMVIKEIREAGYNKEIQIVPEPYENSISIKDLITFYKKMGLKILQSNNKDMGKVRMQRSEFYG